MTMLALLGRLRGAPVTRDEALVRIKGGYRPDTIVARAGRPIRVTFRREESAACSERVLFPTLGKSAMLPPFEDVPLDLLVEKPGEHEFTCQMGMLRGRLIVRSDPGEAA
jgi:plastocyanin domain-containing protein